MLLQSEVIFVNDSQVLDDFNAFQDCLTINMKALQSFAML
jgi:hypothetical protein